MVTILSLWLPILVAAVLVFIVSSIIHTLLPYHRSDFGPVPDEGAVRAGLSGVPPGDYVVPHAASNEERRTEEFKAKIEEGPVAFMTVLPRGQLTMGASLVQWFLYCVLVGVFAAYLAGRTLGPGAEYLTVFRFSGTVAFAGYGLALLQNSIWLGRRWSSTLKSVFDALVYALLTAGAFGWLWPG
ncbi:MAG TPA: hypothetical protein VK837_12035 [Longimicrobiales bacterium]|nr:hypothetical protein [Longimicrobiales bacterium]